MVHLMKMTIIYLLVILCTGTVCAATLTVGSGGSYATIQSAINASVDGDEVLVYPGSYSENINFNGKDIRVYSSGGMNVTTIHGGGADTVVKFWISGVPSQVLEGFTITGGSATVGGGISTSFSDPLIKDCRIIGNNATQGGGLFLQGGQPRIEGCTIISNSATIPFAGFNWGGGAYVDQSLAEFSNCIFQANSTSGDGGGVMIRYNYGAGSVGAAFTDCDIFSNTAMNGAGVAVLNSASPVFTRTRITLNNAFWGTGANLGGGVYSDDACPQFESCLITENHAGNSQGSVGKGGGLYFSAFGSCGGSLINNCTISRNTAGYGGSVPGFGGGICNDAGLNLIENSILWGNLTTGSNGDQIAVENTPAIAGYFVTIRWSDLQGGAAAVYQAFPVNFTSSNIIDQDPLFINATGAGNNFRLQPASPCIEGGDPGYIPAPGATDYDDVPRRLGPIVDMGCYGFIDCSVFTNYGPVTPHSSGPGAVIGATGSSSLVANNLTLTVTGAPPNTNGIFYYGPKQVEAPSYNGFSVVGGGTQRISISVLTDGSGNASLALDLTQPPFNSPPNQITANSIWNFQFWFRDGGSANFTDGLAIAFCP